MNRTALRRILSAEGLIRRVAGSFEDAIEGKKFKNPETGNDVAFGSLPEDEQKKIRQEWSEKGDSADKPISKQLEKAHKTYGKDVIESILDAAKKLSGYDRNNFLQCFERGEFDEDGSPHAPGWKPPKALLNLPKNKRPPSNLLSKLLKKH